MSTFCSLDGSNCKSSSHIYGVYDPTTSKIHKLSFSKNLVQHIAKKTNLQAKTFDYVLGKRLH